MNWYSFIFSEKKSHRLLRHLVFWLLWWMYFTVSFYHYEQSGLQKAELEPWNFPLFIKSILLLSIHITACYYFISYLMPQYLFKARYIALVTQTLILGFLILLSSYFIHKTVLPLIHSAFNYEPVIANQNIWWTTITSGLLSAPKVICAAAAIKLLKRWWRKQKEKERLEKEKLMTDLQLLKAQMHPEFLFSSLDNICLMTQKKNIDGASMLLLKLADILSYILYECDNKLVLLEKEIKVIKDYLVLEKNRMGNRLEIDLAVKGETGDKMIAPLLLFSFIENCFSYIGNKKLEANWINLEFQIETNEVTMRLIHGKAAEPLVQSTDENAIAKAMKRLDFFYPGNYELKTTVEPEIMMTYLRIVLDESVNENENSIYTPEQMAYATV
jgi:two-component system LytT family sensor kinase